MAKSDLFVASKRPNKEDGIVREKHVSVKRVKYEIQKIESAIRSIRARELHVYKTVNNPQKIDWDRAHDVYEDCVKKGMVVDFVEPAKYIRNYTDNHKEKKAQRSDTGYLKNWPAPEGTKDSLVWHLGDEFTELAKAREHVQNNVIDKFIRIAHIDTGYHPTHPSTPVNIQWQLGKSFVDEEKRNPAIDDKKNTQQEQQGHGCATMAILAGNYVTKDKSDGHFEGWIGAAPFAEVIPIRICKSVTNIHAKSFVEAVEYAIETGCEVITISMGGTPSRAWAKVINKAYEKGITIIASAGNSWIKGTNDLLPKALLYPARFDRVIAACGAAFNHEPYVAAANTWSSEEIEGPSMQGNFGPHYKMDSAMSAYTSNIVWATKNQKSPFTKSGGGTSCSAPQIAAAAAMWILENRSFIKDRGYSGTWKQVESVRHALFTAAKKDPFNKKYLGNGILKAYQALFIQPEELDLIKSDEATVHLKAVGNSLGIFEPLKGEELDLIDPVTKDMLSLEIFQLMHELPDLYDYLKYDWDQDEKITEIGPKDVAIIFDCLLESNKTSLHLKRRIRRVRIDR